MLLRRITSDIGDPSEPGYRLRVWRYRYYLSFGLHSRAGLPVPEYEMHRLARSWLDRDAEIRRFDQSYQKWRHQSRINELSARYVEIGRRLNSILSLEESVPSFGITTRHSREYYHLVSIHAQIERGIRAHELAIAALEAEQ